MFDTFFGLPTHAIVVHAVVVLVPLTALAALALTLVPRWRGRYGVLAGIGAVTSTGSVFVAEQSGERLEDRVLGAEDAPFELVLRHTDIGESLLPWVLVMSIALLVLLGPHVWSRRGAEPRPGWLGWAGYAIGAVSVVGAVLSVIWVVRIGHSGAEAVWSDLPS